MDLRAIAESKLANELKELYIQLFSDKYKTAPHIEDRDLQLFNWLASKHERPRATEIIKAFMKLTDKFVVEQGYPIHLLKSKMNQILIAIGNKEASKAPLKQALLVRFICRQCDSWYQRPQSPKQQTYDPFQDLCDECKKLLPT